MTSADGRVVRISRAALNPKKEKKKREHVRGPVPVARQALERKKYKYNVNRDLKLHIFFHLKPRRPTERGWISAPQARSSPTRPHSTKTKTSSMAMLQTSASAAYASSGTRTLRRRGAGGGRARNSRTTHQVRRSGSTQCRAEAVPLKSGAEAGGDGGAKLVIAVTGATGFAQIPYPKS